MVDAGITTSIAPFIGYTDELVEGSWGWTDGATSTYTNWSSGEPNNSDDEACGGGISCGNQMVGFLQTACGDGEIQGSTAAITITITTKTTCN